MIALLGASAITLTALQATINAPTDAFRGCLKEAVAKGEPAARTKLVKGQVPFLDRLTEIVGGRP